jgi:hypothetical protein
LPLDKLLTLFAASVGAVGSVYVLRSYLAMTPALTADLATPRWGFSTVIIDSLSDQRAESVVGAGAFVVALLLAIASMFVPSCVLLSTFGGVLLAVLGNALLVGVMDWLRRRIASRHRERSRRTLSRFVNACSFIIATITISRRFAIA